ncbi:unnamed protein product [Chilo suppressalis]|uniref:Trichohyalin-plectin-homology domain-containing protein n=1 Tax=Chilo suppressalis TaxID=168631 RepID=A0ABN8B2Y9_CHISP|nr:unnamed protein product [Chilo suppressalis]
MYIQEILTKEALKECSYCKEKEERIKKYYEETEKEKVEQCLRALEREKIARGIFGTREDEIRLREMQKLQMIEKQSIEQENENIEGMWHQILLNDVRRKQELERREAKRRHVEMLDRRKAYDEQIASANRRRQELLQEEREKERRRLEKMREKMERDHYEEIKKKREQQLMNKHNFIEGHKLKTLKKIEDRAAEREIDNNTIRTAMQELKEEKLRKKQEMLKWRREEEIFTENFNRERKIAEELDVEGDRVVQEWKQQEEQKADEFLRQVENEKNDNKNKAVQDYQRHLQKLKENMIKERIERAERMHQVSRTAYKELQRKMESANQELKKQMDFRDTLYKQIQDNQKLLESNIIETESKDWPFTRKSEMFSDVMLNRYKQTSARKSTNPVHPFKRMIEAEEIKSTVHLPVIGTKYK